MAGTAPVVIRKVWRSELILLGLFAISLPITILLSQKIPSSVVTGPLLSFAGWRLVLSLPLFWLIPFCLASYATFRIFDVQYTMDARGIQARVGRLSFSQRINRVRFEDVRSLEVRQSLLDRALGIGAVEIGTAGTSEIEMALKGIGAPQEVQELVQNERDLRQEAPKGPASIDGAAPRVGTSGVRSSVAAA